MSESYEATLRKLLYDLDVARGTLRGLADHMARVSERQREPGRQSLEEEIATLRRRLELRDRDLKRARNQVALMTSGLREIQCRLSPGWRHEDVLAVRKIVQTLLPDWDWPWVEKSL